MKKRFSMILVVAMALGGCSRGVTVGSDVNAAYRVEIHNLHTTAMTVSYTDSKGTHELGTLKAGETMPFVVPSSSGSAVTLMGMTTGGGHYTKAVTLSTGTTVKTSL